MKNSIKTNRINSIFIFCVCLLLATIQCVTTPVDIYSAKKPTKSSRKVAKKSSLKSKSKPKIKRVAPSSHVFITDTMLSSGIIYKQLLLSINNLKHNVNIVQIDLNNPFAEVNIIKGGNNIVELERLPEMLSNSKVDTSKKEIKAGINANFWRAMTNYPIGPTIIDGEVAEMQVYKKWTSTFFNEDGLPFTNSFSIQGEIVTQNGSYRIPISSVNRRSDSNGVVIYNKYGGDIIPYINSQKAQELMLQTMDNIFVEGELVDSTEDLNSLEVQKDYLLEVERSSKKEYDYTKLVVQYIDTPAVNTFIRCKVVDSVVGSVPTSSAGCVISIGKNMDTTTIPKIGDIINLHFWTNVHESEVFTNSVCGTPRLVRDGTPNHEAYEEGSTKKRFINGALPRSAIGYNKNKTKLFLVAVTSGKKQDGTTGASLAQLADIMEYIGCYHAQNLDGGGSTNMLIGKENIINPTASRRLSVAIAAIKLKQEKSKAKLPRRKR